MKLLGPLPPLLVRKPYLFRIETLDRLYEILKNSQLTFVRPRLWSDPLENIIFNAKLIKNGRPYIHPASNCIYGQCWSMQADSYALWQIYTTKTENGKLVQSHGLRITTHLEKLKAIGKQNEGDFFYGAMQYKSRQDLDNLKKNKEFLGGLKKEKVNEEHLHTLLVKRRSYSYESEMRLLAVPGPGAIDKKNDNLCRLSIDPKDFITSMLFDPRMDREEFLAHKEKLVTEWKFRPTQIKQSSLAQGNSFKFDLDKSR